MMVLAARFVSLTLATAAVLGAGACGTSAPAEPVSVPPPKEPPRPAEPAEPVELVADAGVDASAAKTGDAGVAAAEVDSACPADMVLVDTTYCPKVERRCLKDEYNKPNHITICHEFAPGTKCIGKERRQRFCIDKYEYPNEKGAHPPVMVDAYDAAGLCAARGKRLCWESEWVAACEGPDKLPFPYGLARDPTACNIDNPWRNPDLEAVYSSNPKVQDAELRRLDQSVPSGERERCVSGFGVHDLTGNFDEWVLAEQEVGESKWSRLKGGAWGHVRNACRPYTTSHPPEFTYYFISFRCCADPKPDPEVERDPRYFKLPPVVERRDPSGKISEGWTPR